MELYVRYKNACIIYLNKQRYIDVKILLNNMKLFWRWGWLLELNGQKLLGTTLTIGSNRGIVELTQLVKLFWLNTVKIPNFTICIFIFIQNVHFEQARFIFNGKRKATKHKYLIQIKNLRTIIHLHIFNNSDNLSYLKL